jgi:hypothetical protein
MLPHKHARIIQRSSSSIHSSHRIHSITAHAAPSSISHHHSPLPVRSINPSVSPRHPPSPLGCYPRIRLYLLYHPLAPYPLSTCCTSSCFAVHLSRTRVTTSRSRSCIRCRTLCVPTPVRRIFVDCKLRVSCIGVMMGEEKRVLLSLASSIHLLRSLSFHSPFHPPCFSSLVVAFFTELWNVTHDDRPHDSSSPTPLTLRLSDSLSRRVDCSRVACVCLAPTRLFVVLSLSYCSIRTEPTIIH